MKKILIALTAILSTSVFADIKLDARDLTVTEVKIGTPLPTGLESIGGARDAANALYAAMKKHPNVAPFVTSTETLYKNKLKDAEKYGNNASVAIDCKKHPAPYGAENKDMCAVSVRKTYGWYADLDLVIEIEGYIHKSFETKVK